MNNYSTAVAAMFVVGAMLTQCSSAKKQSASTPDVPDVSQVSSSASTGSTPPQLTILGNPKFYRNDSVKLTTESDSLLTKKNAQNSGTRILHIAGNGTSVYDTRYDSIRPRINPKHDSEVGIVSSEEAMKLSASLSNAEIVTLSLVDSVLYNNFEQENLEQKFAHYGARYVLLTVAEKDSYQRTAFVVEFYQEWMSTKDYEKAFENAWKSAKKKNPSVDFKARLIKK
jgi:hypothetical protein